MLFSIGNPSDAKASSVSDWFFKQVKCECPKGSRCKERKENDIRIITIYFANLNDKNNTEIRCKGGDSVFLKQEHYENNILNDVIWLEKGKKTP